MVDKIVYLNFYIILNRALNQLDSIKNDYLLNIKHF